MTNRADRMPRQQFWQEDFIDELLAWADRIDRSQGEADFVMQSGAVFVDAAGEIINLSSMNEVLQEELQQARLDHITTIGELQDAVSEIERLRGLLAELLTDNAYTLAPYRKARYVNLYEGGWHHDSLESANHFATSHPDGRLGVLFLLPDGTTGFLPENEARRVQ